MTMWPPKKGALRRPAYRSLARSLIDAIEAGEVRPGMRLPTHRALAFELGLSVHTVSRAYDELSRLGIITGEVGRGSFVAAGERDPAMPWQRLSQGGDVVDCSMLTPVTAPIQAERMSATLAELAEDLDPSVLFSFRPRATFEEHCDLARRWLARCGVEVEAERILPTNGSTAAMAVALMAAAVPGDMVVTEELGHHTLPSLTGTLGLRLAGLPIDREGIVPEGLERACATAPVKVLYLMPSGLNPTVATMGAERRAALVDICRQNNVLIVENDAWGPLEPTRAPAFAALAPERTFYFTGLTKCLVPGLRLGWLVAPTALMPAARTRHLVTHWMATPLMAEIASRWIVDGTAEELLAFQRGELAARNEMVRGVLRDIPHAGAAHGLHIWLPLPDVWHEDEFVAEALSQGVAIAAGSKFAMSPDAHHAPGVRVCIGAGSQADIERAMAVIARLALGRPEPTAIAV